MHSSFWFIPSIRDLIDISRYSPYLWATWALALSCVKHFNFVHTGMWFTDQSCKEFNKTPKFCTPYLCERIGVCNKMKSRPMWRKVWVIVRVILPIYIQTSIKTSPALFLFYFYSKEPFYCWWVSAEAKIHTALYSPPPSPKHFFKFNFLVMASYLYVKNF